MVALGRGPQVPAQQRAEALEHIAAHPEPPVLILGGGVNGTGLFRELALQGVDCVLVDKADLFEDIYGVRVRLEEADR